MVNISKQLISLLDYKTISSLKCGQGLLSQNNSQLRDNFKKCPKIIYDFKLIIIHFKINF